MKTLHTNSYWLSVLRHCRRRNVYIVCSLLLAACLSPLNMNDETAAFSISLGGRGSGRAVDYPPDENPEAMEKLKFTAIFVPAGGGQEISFSSEGDDTITGIIAAGTYNVSVEITLLENGSFFAKGDAANNPVTIIAGSSNPITVTVEQVTFTVSFDSNGGTGIVPESISDILASNEITLPGGDGLSNGSLFFGGWNTSADGSGIIYSAGELYTPVDNMILYARWLGAAPAPSIVITSSGLSGLKVNQAVSAGIMYTLSNGTYANSITVSDFVVENLPAGLNADIAERTSNTLVTIPITGTPITYNAGPVYIALPASIASSNVAEAASAIIPTGSVTASAVAKGDGAAVSGAPAVSGTPAENSITVFAVTIPANPGGQTVEYARSTFVDAPESGWQPGTTFSSLASGTSYYIFARSAENQNYNAGPIQRSGVIKTTGTPVPFIEVSTTGLAAGLKVGQTVSNASVRYILTNGTYVNPITPADFVISGLPQGLNAGAAERTSNTLVTVPITGKPTVYSANPTTITRPPSIPASSVSGATAAILLTDTLTAGAVAKGDGAAVTKPVVSAGTPPTQNTITVNAVSLVTPTGQGIQYNRSTQGNGSGLGTWQSGTQFTGLAAGTPYYIYARSEASGNYNAGESNVSDAIQTLGFLNASNFSVTNLAWTYNGNQQGATVNYDGGITEGQAGIITVRYNGGINVPTLAGSYAITVTTAGGSLYAAVTSPISFGNLVISPRTITITPNAGQSKVYNTVDPVFSYTPSEILIAGNSFTGALSRASGSNAGTYAINLGTLSAGPNYTLNLGGTVFFTINKAEGAAVSNAPVVSIFTPNSIVVGDISIEGTNPGSQEVEYAFSTTITVPTNPSAWNKGTNGYTFNGLNRANTNYLFARSAATADGNYSAGEAKVTTVTSAAYLYIDIGSATPLQAYNHSQAEFPYGTNIPDNAPGQIYPAFLNNLPDDFGISGDSLSIMAGRYSFFIIYGGISGRGEYKSTLGLTVDAVNVISNEFTLVIQP